MNPKAKSVDAGSVDASELSLLGGELDKNIPAPASTQAIVANDDNYNVCEPALIGCVVRYGKCALGVIETKADSMIFRDVLHRRIYGAACEMVDHGDVVDFDALAHKLGDDALLEQMGGVTYLGDLEDAAPYVVDGGDIGTTVERLIVDLGVQRASATNAPIYSEDYLAQRFAAQHQQGLRYVGEWNVWMRFDGHRWIDEKTLIAYHFARIVCREAADILKETDPKGSDGKVAALASAKTVSAVEKLAKSDRRLAATVDQWDVDPWKLNTPGGVINLKTGAISSHRPDDYMTKITAVAPGGECPLFMAFLDRVTGGDVELQGFLARIFGYALTGLTVEHAMFFFFGTGANGKSVLLETVSGILRDYAQATPMETFTASKQDRHLTEIADLQGARLVTASETEEGRALAEARIKLLTGGERIKARKMRQDLFAFTPQFKLIMAGNHKPTIKSVDEAMKRRVNLIPFTITIPREERDPDLASKLKQEWPGILKWMVDGCLEWQRVGLSPPTIVTEATAEYLEGEDTMIAWIAERCQKGPGYRQKSSELYKSFKAFAEAAGEEAGSNKAFSSRLEAHDFKKDRTNLGMMFFGIMLNPLMTGSE